MVFQHDSKLTERFHLGYPLRSHDVLSRLKLWFLYEPTLADDFRVVYLVLQTYSA